MFTIWGLSIDSAQLIGIVLSLLLVIPMLIAMIHGAPFVPTPQGVVDKMIKFAKLKKGMKVVDPGCGDGRMLITATKRYDVAAVGYELFFFPYLLAKARNFFSKGKAKIYFKDSRKVDLSDVDVILCYLLPEPLKKLSKKWEKELKKGARVVSYAFSIADWKPIHVEEKIPEKNQCKILVYEMGKHKP